jgi:hypothetical protein
MDIVVKACSFLREHYGVDKDGGTLGVTNLSGLDVSAGVFETGRMEMFKSLCGPGIHHATFTMEMEFVASSLLLAPSKILHRTSADCDDRRRKAILAVSEHVGMKDLWTVEEIDRSILGTGEDYDVRRGVYKRVWRRMKMDVAVEACRFLRKYYRKTDLVAMNLSAVEVPAAVFESGDLAAFKADRDVHDGTFTAEMEFVASSLLLAPSEFNAAAPQYERHKQGILAVLEHVGMKDLWSVEDINHYILRNGTIRLHEGVRRGVYSRVWFTGHWWHEI